MADMGFRKSFLGFNRDDVLNYISALVKKNKETVLKIKDEKNELNLRNNALTQKIEELNNLLKEYKEKEEQIEKLANGMGALYVLAKNNAVSILENAKAGKEITVAEIEKNVSLIELSQTDLNNIKTSMNNITSNFNNNIDELSNSFNLAKEQIKKNVEASDKAEAFLKNPVFNK